MSCSESFEKETLVSQNHFENASDRSYSPIQKYAAKPNPFSNLALQRRKVLVCTGRMEAQLKSSGYRQAVDRPCLDGLLRPLEILPKYGQILHYWRRG